MPVTSAKNIKSIWLLTPLFGTIIFVCLYFVATRFYPGGSQVHKKSVGFSWAQNYWCNLLNESAINGQPNAARPIALTAMFVLCVTLTCFWYIIPLKAGLQKGIRLVIQISGLLAMILAMFLFTNHHDAIVNAASAFGIVATIGTFVCINWLKWSKLLWLGIFNLALIVLNNILYYNEGLLIYLPIVQKITFLFFLIWICLIDIKLYKRSF